MADVGLLIERMPAPEMLPGHERALVIELRTLHRLAARAATPITSARRALSRGNGCSALFLGCAENP